MYPQQTTHGMECNRLLQSFCSFVPPRSVEEEYKIPSIKALLGEEFVVPPISDLMLQPNNSRLTGEYLHNTYGSTVNTTPRIVCTNTLTGRSDQNEVLPSVQHIQQGTTAFERSGPSQPCSKQVYSKKKMSFGKAALTLLKESRVPMTTTELVRRAIERGIIKSSSRTPQFIMGTDISRDMKKKGDNSMFVRISPGTYGIKGIDYSALEKELSFNENITLIKKYKREDI
ncbi:protein translocase subunit SecA [Acrasis kona]|uniref:Protein translocase subunit SecA n=1 Tax=Acrasis kona TaxID=1008807 RepID=A0AAW2ZSQ5_9EUKA